MNTARQGSGLRPAFALGLALYLMAPFTAAAPLSIDDIRGSSNRALCDFSQYDRIEAEQIASEINKRRLDCATHSGETSGVDYTPDVKSSHSDSRPTALPPGSQHKTEPTSASIEQPSALEDEELAHLQEEVQKEADRLLDKSGEQNKQPNAPPASAARSSSPFYPPAGVVRISAGRTVGSGFYANELLIVTNAHVVENHPTVAIAFSGKSSFSGEVVYRNDELDFAMIQASIKGSPLPIRQGPIVIGENIIAMGFPQGRQVIASSTGTVVDVAECCILHDALIAAGNSGGPLLDARHEVLGLNTLLSKKPGDKANETDRAITVRMDFITKILASEQPKATPTE